MIVREEFALPPVHRPEVFRYAGIREVNTRWEEELDRQLAQCADVFDGRVCWDRFPVTVDGDRVDMTFAAAHSRALARNLQGCSEVILFAATVGIGIDRLIRRSVAGKVSDAVWLQAIGAERIEALCDTFCEAQRALAEKEGFYLRPRFSPGYGDLPLTLQTAIFRTLDCSRQIGLSLTESLLMVPGKSVTAVVGICDKPCHPGTLGCSYCGKKDCAFRKEN